MKRERKKLKVNWMFIIQKILGMAAIIFTLWASKSTGDYTPCLLMIPIGVGLLIARETIIQV